MYFQRVLRRGIRQLVEWTDATAATVVYDSAGQPINHGDFAAKVRDQQNVAVITCTDRGFVFGAFFSARAPPNAYEWNDPGAFVFSLESHGLCETPRRFVPYDRTGVAVRVADDFVGCCSIRGERPGPVGIFVSTGSLFFGDESAPRKLEKIDVVFDGAQAPFFIGAECAEAKKYLPVRLIAVQLTLFA